MRAPGAHVLAFFNLLHVGAQNFFCELLSDRKYECSCNNHYYNYNNYYNDDYNNYNHRLFS